MVAVIAKLNQNLFFRYISSIRLAVPIMLSLIIAVSIGTIIESRYNTEYAQLLIYNAPWFLVILFLLGINIFCAMMSRYPWKMRHLGFVVTHIGMIVLLTGGFITKFYGIDGSMQIQEGQTQNTITLPKMMIGYQFEGSPTLSSVVFSKSFSDKSKEDLDFINTQIGHVLQVNRFIPFASVERGYKVGTDSTGPVGLSFGLKSAFFDVKDWLHSVDNPVYQMGPATLKLIIDEDNETPLLMTGLSSQKPKKKSQRSSLAGDDGKLALKKNKSLYSDNNEKNDSFLLVYHVNDEKLIRKISLKELRGNPVQIEGTKISMEHFFRHAIVAENKIVDNADPTASLNPALELKIEKGSEKFREVLYAKYEGFSLHQQGVFGLKFRFEFLDDAVTADSKQPPSETNSPMPNDIDRLPAGHPNIAEAQSPGAEMANLGNVIEFHVSRKLKDQVNVVLLKGGKKVDERKLREGESFQTPWMGINLFLASINFGAERVMQVSPVVPSPGVELPPSAVEIQPVGSDPFWLVQGEYKKIVIGGREAYVVFSNETMNLPFELQLNQFNKKNYPGTETPYSYESLVTNLQDQKQTLISMNEPLKVAGYTLYQASFNLTPGQKPTSILSVNKDPGRWIKYLGSLILSLGVIIFTLMKSRFYRQNI